MDLGAVAWAVLARYDYFIIIIIIIVIIIIVMIIIIILIGAFISICPNQIKMP